jgi:hypothetical protein
MRKVIFFLIVSASFLLCFQGVFAQDNYNIEGDRALQKNDYQDAVFWFSEGLDNCDITSIRRLTEIWKSQAAMRESMYLPMLKCFKCLKPLAEKKDKDAMLLISDYYNNGIGIPQDSVEGTFWYREYGTAMGFSQVNSILDSLEIFPIKEPPIPRKSLLSNKFYSFVTYTYSPTMPVGFTLGFYNKFGVYFSYKSSTEKVNYAYECNNTEVPAIGIENPPYSFDREKWKGRMISGGIIFPVIDRKLFLTVGGGFGKRDYYREIVTSQSFPSGSKSEWCYNTEASYKGVVIEAGGVFKWKYLIVSGGFNSTALKDLDGYLGLGFSF